MWYTSSASSAYISFLSAIFRKSLGFASSTCLEVGATHLLDILFKVGEDLGDGAIAAVGAGVILGDYVGFKRYGQLQVVDSECAGIEDVELSGVPWPAGSWLECV